MNTLNTILGNLAGSVDTVLYLSDRNVPAQHFWALLATSRGPTHTLPGSRGIHQAPSPSARPGLVPPKGEGARGTLTEASDSGHVGPVGPLDSGLGCTSILIWMLVGLAMRRHASSLWNAAAPSKVCSIPCREASQDGNGSLDRRRAMATLRTTGAE